MTRRQSDSENAEIEYRRSSSRTFERNGKWYFSSREGEFGPFDTQAEADEDMQGFVGLIDLRLENEGPVTPD